MQKNVNELKGDHYEDILVRFLFECYRLITIVLYLENEKHKLNILNENLWQKEKQAKLWH